MLIPKRELRNCLQVSDFSSQSDLIEIPCMRDCAKCGHDRLVAQKRQQRIRANDWSYRENGIRFLHVGKDEKK